MAHLGNKSCSNGEKAATTTATTAATTAAATATRAISIAREASVMMLSQKP